MNISINLKKKTSIFILIGVLFACQLVLTSFQRGENMNMDLEPRKKKGLILIVLIVLIIICTFMVEKHRGLCAASVVLAVGFTLLVLAFNVLIGKEVMAQNKYLYIAQNILWIALIIFLYLFARSECRGS